MLMAIALSILASPAMAESDLKTNEPKMGVHCDDERLSQSKQCACATDRDSHVR